MTLREGDRLDRAAAALIAGKPVLVYDADGREEETDVFFAGHLATPERIRTLRRDAGGLVFLAVAHPYGARFGLPFLQDLYAEDAPRHPVLADLIPNDIKYDTRSSFSLTLNHRDTFTGITDNDRSLTVQQFVATCQQAEDMNEPQARKLLGSRFRAPGHVHLCVAAPRLLDDRQGHTELAVALAHLAGVPPVLVGAEMLGDDGGALKPAAAEAWAAERDTIRIEGQEIIAAWQKVKSRAAVPALE